MCSVMSVLLNNYLYNLQIPFGKEKKRERMFGFFSPVCIVCVYNEYNKTWQNGKLIFTQQVALGGRSKGRSSGMEAGRIFKSRTFPNPPQAISQIVLHPTVMPPPKLFQDWGLLCYTPALLSASFVLRFGQMLWIFLLSPARNFAC